MFAIYLKDIGDWNILEHYFRLPPQYNILQVNINKYVVKYI